MNDPCAKGRTWRAGRYELEHEPSGRWGASDGARGVAARKTALKAILDLWRARRDNRWPLRKRVWATLLNWWRCHD